MEASIKKNYLYNLLYQILVVVTPLVTAPYTARVFGADGIGIQSYTNSVVSYFVLFATLGTYSYGQREIAIHNNSRQEYSKAFWEIEGISFFSTIISFLLWVIFIFLFGNEYSKYYIVQSISIIAVALDITWLFAGLENFKKIVIRNVIIRLIGIASVFAFVRKKEDLTTYIFIWSFINLLGGCSLWIYLPRILDRVRISELSLKKHFKQILVYFVPTIATSIYTMLDKTMIGIITNDSYSNGYYEQAEKIVKMSQSVLLSLNTVMYSRMSFLYAKNQIKELQYKLEKALDFLMFLAIPMAFGISGISFGFVEWFLGPGYEQVVPLLIMFSPLLIIIGISSCICNQYLAPTNQKNRENKAVIIGAVANFFLNLSLIPRWGSMGAAIATVLAELLITAIVVLYAKNIISYKYVLICVLKRVPAALIMFTVIYIIGSRSEFSLLNTIKQVLIGSLIYFVLEFLLKDEIIYDGLKVITNKRGK